MQNCHDRTPSLSTSTKYLRRNHSWRSPRPVALATFLLLTLSSPGRVGASMGANRAVAAALLTHPATDSAAVARVVARFRDAISAGDSATALSMLSPDVLVLESGDVETFAQYRTHHLGADIAFARAVPGVHSALAVQVAGSAAWVTSTSVTQGTFQGRAVNSAGAELMVLTRSTQAAPWLIRAIHWSSHRRTK